MTATLDIIAEYLASLDPAIVIAAPEGIGSRKISLVALVDGEGRPRLLKDGGAPLLQAQEGDSFSTIGAGALIVGAPEACAAALARFADAVALCVASELPPEAVEAAEEDRFCQAVTALPPASIALAAQECLRSMVAWVGAMEEALLDGGSFQELLDLSEPILGNPLVLSDAGFRIVAHTHTLVPDEPAVRDAIEHGCFSNASMESFRRKGRPSAWRSIGGISVLDGPNDRRPYPVVNYIFRVQGRYAMHLVMHCSPLPYTAGLRDLLQCLIDVMELQLKRLSSGSFFEEGAPAALGRLLTGDRPAKAVLQVLERAGFGGPGPFRVLVFDYGYGDDEPQLPAYGAFRLMEETPSLLVSIIGSRIVALGGEGREGEGDLSSFLERHAREYGCRIGLSDGFDGLENASFAYRQACFSLEVAQRHQRALGFQGAEVSGGLGEAAIAPFADCFCDFAVLCGVEDEDLLDYCAARSVPALLRAEADGGRCDDFATLRAYIEGGGRATVAAESLHLHRTTLLYRLGRIAERFGLDLSDAACRDRLAMEYRLVDLGFGVGPPHRPLLS